MSTGHVHRARFRIRTIVRPTRSRVRLRFPGGTLGLLRIRRTPPQRGLPSLLLKIRRDHRPNRSKVAALEWLPYLNRKTHVDIRQARNRGEHVIPHGPQRLHVDGYDERTRTVFKFHGCFWHGSVPQVSPRPQQDASQNG